MIKLVFLLTVLATQVADYRMNDFVLMNPDSCEINLEQYEWKHPIVEDINDTHDGYLLNSKQQDRRTEGALNSLLRGEKGSSISEVANLSDRQMEIDSALEQFNLLRISVMSIEDEQNRLRRRLYKIATSQNVLNITSENLAKGLESKGQYFPIIGEIRRYSNRELNCKQEECEQEIHDLENQLVTLVEQQEIPHDLKNEFDGVNAWEDVRDILQQQRNKILSDRKVSNSVLDIDILLMSNVEYKRIHNSLCSARGKVCLEKSEIFCSLILKWNRARIRKCQIETMIEIRLARTRTEQDKLQRCSSEKK